MYVSEGLANAPGSEGGRYAEPLRRSQGFALDPADGPIRMIAQSGLGVRVGLRGKLNQDRSLLDAHGKGGEAGVGFRMVFYASASKVEGPGMERTYNRSTGENAFGQGTAAMRTAVFDGAEFAAKIEDGDLAAGDRDGFAFAERNAFT